MPQASNRLNQLLIETGSTPLDLETAAKFQIYLALLQKWNARTNLTAIRDEEGILSRHFLECIRCAQHLPTNIGSLLDFGSGAGFPGIPIALIRKDLKVTLAESQNKKAAFLREAVRVLDLEATVHSGRAETLAIPYDCIALRAVDDMPNALSSSVALLKDSGWLSILTTNHAIPAIQAQSVLSGIQWQEPIPTTPNTDRILLIGQSRTKVD